MASIVQHTIKIILNGPLSLNKGIFVKKGIDSISFSIMMGKQDHFVKGKILNILKILTSTIYLMFPPSDAVNYLSGYEGN